jgi:hypothetical protein
MFFKDKHCPTCKGSGTQVFTPLKPGERKALGTNRTDLWRCTAAGCRWYQPWDHQAGGGRLPEELQNPGADASQ